MGEVTEFTNFMDPVIEQSTFNSIKAYIYYAAASDEASFLWGGKYDDGIGFFIEPTIIVTFGSCFKTMEEEIPACFDRLCLP